MSIFILANKNLKGKWRNLLVALYATNILLFLGIAFMYNKKLVSEEISTSLIMIWLLVGLSIGVVEYLFHKYLKGKIKS